MKLSTKTSLWLVISGVISLILGVVVIAYPTATLATLAIILGIGILATGVLQLASYFSYKEALKNPGWTLVAGILDIVIGLLLLFNPVATTLTIPFIIGFWALFASITRIAGSVTLKQLGFKNWWVALLIGILGIIIAFCILAHPVLGALLVTTYIGAFFIFWGVSALVEAFSIKAA